jgi:D-glycero-alpha-D-manno-heptose-7-phosphate kinase
MIITKTPLRISFFSGGSDLPSFYEKENGAALSATIDKYVYVMMHKTPHINIRTMYDTVEEHPDIEKMQHDITRESLKYFFSNSAELTVASISDILAKGSGLGSSSAFTVGLVHAIQAFIGQKTITRNQLAELSCEIEMNRCGYPIGKQDQYAATYGGFNLFEFFKNETVSVNSLAVSQETLATLQDNLLLVYSGMGRMANSILQKQKTAMSDRAKFELVKKSRNKAYVAYAMLANGKTEDFGRLLHEAWLDKKGVVADISNEYFDSIYSKAIEAGALGGKLLGAGGGGFFLFYVPSGRRIEVMHAIDQSSNNRCKFYDFKFVDTGSQIVANC